MSDYDLLKSDEKNKNLKRRNMELGVDINYILKDETLMRPTAS